MGWAKCTRALACKKKKKEKKKKVQLKIGAKIDRFSGRGGGGSDLRVAFTGARLPEPPGPPVRAQHVKDRVNVTATVVVPSDARLEELRECVNQKITEVTRNQTANDDEHRDELPQTRRRKAVSV